MIGAQQMGMKKKLKPCFVPDLHGNLAEKPTTGGFLRYSVSRAQGFTNEAKNCFVYHENRDAGKPGFVCDEQSAGIFELPETFGSHMYSAFTSSETIRIIKWWIQHVAGIKIRMDRDPKRSGCMELKRLMAPTKIDEDVKKKCMMMKMAMYFTIYLRLWI